MKKHFILSGMTFLFIANLLAQITPEPTIPSLQISAETSLVDGPVTKITFDEVTFDFGKVEHGERVKHIFRFTNTGNEPLVLSNAKGSCGCTVPSWPKEPIAPGETGAIVVEFDTKGKTGRQNKQVTITANTTPPHSLVYIKGEIDAEKQPENTSLLIAPAESTAPKVVEKTDSQNRISVWPNPANTSLWLKMEDAAGQSAQIEIFSNNGQLLHKQSIHETGGDPVSLDVADFENGNYWLSVQLGDARRESLPFVVMR